MKSARWTSLLALLLSAQAWADPVIKYAIDPARTVINFSWRYWGRESPQASFSNPSGYIYFNAGAPEQSSAEVSIPVRTLSTFTRVIDRELLNSGDFFQPEKYPVITFRSTGITLASAAGMPHKVAGLLTVNGISQPVVLMSRPVGPRGALPDDVLAVDASTSFPRSRFGMTRLLGVVADDMSIRLQVLAVRQP